MKQVPAMTLRNNQIILSDVKEGKIWPGPHRPKQIKSGVTTNKQMTSDAKEKLVKSSGLTLTYREPMTSHTTGNDTYRDIDELWNHEVKGWC